MSYTYFAATLPMQHFGAPPAMTVAEFAALCREHVSRADSATLSALLDGGATKNAFVKKWRDADTQIRNAVAKLRAQNIGAGADAAKWLHTHDGYSVLIETTVAAAFQESDPMKREQTIEKLRWDLAGDIAGLDMFSFAAILAYAIRLGIAEHLSSANTEKGEARLRDIANKEQEHGKDSATPDSATAAG